MGRDTGMPTGGRGMPFSRRALLMTAMLGAATLTACAPEQPGGAGPTGPIAATPSPTEGSPSPAAPSPGGFPRPTIPGPTIPEPTATSRPAPPSSAPPLPSPTDPVSRPPIPKLTLPPGPLSALPTREPVMAWTCDDGVDAAVILAYADLARRLGMRFTFFLNGIRPAVSETAAAVRPLVEQGLIQIGNHTWSHPDLTKLSPAGVRAELERNGEYLRRTFGVDPRPYFRPPYGFYDADVLAAAASVGYTVPTLWYGSLADSSVLKPATILRLGERWFAPGRIVIAHLNHPPVISVLDRLAALVQQRGLTTVTLQEVFRAR